MPAESVPTVSTPDGLNATGSTLDEQAKPTKMVNSQTSQSHNSYVSTRLGSKKNGFRNPPTPSRGSSSPWVAVNLTANEPLTCKRKRHEAKDTCPELEQSQPEQAADVVYQQSGETIECLREEVQRLRREKFEQQAQQLALIKGFVTSAAVIEVAVDVRGAELRYGLSNIGGNQEEMREQVQQMMHFSYATSRHVTRLVNNMLEEQQVFLNDDEQKLMRLEFESAQPSQALTGILDEKLLFSMGRSGPVGNGSSDANATEHGPAGSRI